MSDRRQVQRQEADARRRRARPYRAWYASKAWKIRRDGQLRKVPWCEPCKAQGRSRRASIANHNPPHRGDRIAFFHGPLESACKDCHDSAIQRAEHMGFRPDIGEDGWPTDPLHPFNRRRH